MLTNHNERRSMSTFVQLPAEARRRRRTPYRAPDPAHAARNVLEWSAYLPPDCVASMVRMGWDHST